MTSEPGLRQNAPDVELDLSVIEHSSLYNADLAPVERVGQPGRHGPSGVAPQVGRPHAKRGERLRHRPFLAAALAWGEHAGRLVQRWTNVGRDLPGLLVGLGYQRATPNDLRRTLATWLRAAGAEASLVAEVLGHTDSRMVERVYGRLSPAQLAAALESRLASVPNLYRPGSDERDTADAADGGLPRIPAGFAVPRDGIEPPTRGFSVPAIAPRTRRKAG